jgi:hypothetical protein
MAKWGSVTITFTVSKPTEYDYSQKYKRKNVVTHNDANAMAAAAVADSVAKIKAALMKAAVPGAKDMSIVVNRDNISQNSDNDPGDSYMDI